MAEDLDLARGVVQVDEHAAVAHRADPAGDPDALVGLGAGRQRGMPRVEFGGLMAARKADRVGVDPHAAQRFELVEPHAAERIVVIGAHPALQKKLGSRPAAGTTVILIADSLRKAGCQSPAAAAGTAGRPRSITASWKRWSVP